MPAIIRNYGQSMVTKRSDPPASLPPRLAPQAPGKMYTILRSRGISPDGPTFEQSADEWAALRNQVEQQVWSGTQVHCTHYAQATAEESITVGEQPDMPCLALLWERSFEQKKYHFGQVLVFLPDWPYLRLKISSGSVTPLPQTHTLHVKH